jgi:hypothetical protein
MLVMTIIRKHTNASPAHLSLLLQKKKKEMGTPQRVDGGNSSDCDVLCTKIEQMSNYLPHGGEKKK